DHLLAPVPRGSARCGGGPRPGGPPGPRAGPMIRVAYFAPVLVTGGTQRHLQQVLGRLDRARVAARVYTLVPGGEVEAELRAAGVDVVSLALGPRLVAVRAARAIVRAAAALRADGVQVVHGYQWRPALVGAIAARLAGVPLVLASKRRLTGDDTRAGRAWRRIARQSGPTPGGARAPGGRARGGGDRPLHRQARGRAPRARRHGRLRPALERRGDVQRPPRGDGRAPPGGGHRGRRHVRGPCRRRRRAR